MECDVKLFINAKVYTENALQPWAEAFVVEDYKFVFVGEYLEANNFAKLHYDKFETIDLQGKTVLPSFIDGHTHLGLVSKTSWLCYAEVIKDKNKLFENIKKSAEENPKETCPYFVYSNFANETFGTVGPNKRDLDKIISDRPARIDDDAGHGCLYNSVALELLKNENGIPVNTAPIGDPQFIKDENGEYTGWGQQTLLPGDVNIFKKINWYPPMVMDENNTKAAFDMYKKYGVCCYMDGATECEDDIKFLYNLDKQNKLNMYYEATAVMQHLSDIDKVVAQAKDYQKKYTSKHVHCNIVKYFVDGSIEYGDVLSVEPFSNDETGTNYGKANCTLDELKAALVRLNKEGLDFHVHCVCDGSFRMVCDAIEEAQKECGDDWKIRTTIAHCEIINKDDLPRVKKLGIYIDSTPHWSGDAVFDDIPYLGEKRWSQMYDYKQLIEDGAVVGFSSDIVDKRELKFLNPFLGIQIGMTRIIPSNEIDPDRFPNGRPPECAKLSLEQMIHGYSLGNAIKLGLDDKIGSIEVGKDANFIVLSQDVFNVDVDKISETKAEILYFEGSKI